MTITDLFIYPVKSMGGIRVNEARLTSRGLERDRRWMVVRPEGTFVTQRQLPALSGVRTSLIDGDIRLEANGAGSVRLPYHAAADSDRTTVTVWKDDVEAVLAPANVSAWLTDLAGEQLMLVWMPDDADRSPDPAFSTDADRVSFADGYPLLLTGTASLEELNRNLEAPVPMSRFRPNAVVSTAVPWVEEKWRSVTIGEVDLDVAKPCSRCVVTTVPQHLDDIPPGEDRTEPLRTLTRIHTVDGKTVFGVNLIPRSGGVVRVGDELHPRTSVMGS